MGTEGASPHRASSLASWAHGWHSVLGRSVCTQGSSLAQRARPQRVFAPLGPYGPQAGFLHSVFWQRTSSRVGPWVHSWQLVGIERQQYSSYDLLLPPGLFQPRGRSVLFFLLVCRCVVVVVGGALAQAARVASWLGHNLSWSLLAWLGTRGCSAASDFITCCTGSQLAQRARAQPSYKGTHWHSLLGHGLPLVRAGLATERLCTTGPGSSLLVQVLLGACAAGSWLTQGALPRRAHLITWVRGCALCAYLLQRGSGTVSTFYYPRIVQPRGRFHSFH